MGASAQATAIAKSRGKRWRVQISALNVHTHAISTPKITIPCVLPQIKQTMGSHAVRSRTISCTQSTRKSQADHLRTHGPFRRRGHHEKREQYDADRERSVDQPPRSVTSGERAAAGEQREQEWTTGRVNAVEDELAEPPVVLQRRAERRERKPLGRQKRSRLPHRLARTQMPPRVVLGGGDARKRNQRHK